MREEGEWRRQGGREGGGNRCWREGIMEGGKERLEKERMTGVKEGRRNRGRDGQDVDKEGEVKRRRDRRFIGKGERGEEEEG